MVASGRTIRTGFLQTRLAVTQAPAIACQRP